MLYLVHRIQDTPFEKWGYWKKKKMIVYTNIIKSLMEFMVVLMASASYSTA